MDKRIVKTRLGLDCQTPVCVDVINFKSLFEKKRLCQLIVLGLRLDFDNSHNET